jgi:hypothetical protein
MLTAAWMLTLGLSVLCSGLFLQGVIRDTRWGDPVLRLDLSRTSDWVSVPFRVWGTGNYDLFLSTVNHQPDHVGIPLSADFEVSIVDPDDRIVFSRLFQGGTTGHVLPTNYGDSQPSHDEIECLADPPVDVDGKGGSAGPWV